LSHGIRGYARDLTQQEWEVIKPLKEICPKNQPAISKRNRVVLTVTHRDHNPADYSDQD